MNNKKVSKKVFQTFLKSNKTYLENVNCSSPRRKNYYSDERGTKLVAYWYDSYGKEYPEEFVLVNNNCG